jgi:hypothetical protein
MSFQNLVRLSQINSIQRVSEISTLILTSDSSRQEQQNFYVSFFRNTYNFHFGICPPHKLTSCLFTRIF